jgi:hypothetical protein
MSSCPIPRKPPSVVNVRSGPPLRTKSAKVLRREADEHRLAGRYVWRLCMECGQPVRALVETTCDDCDLGRSPGQDWWPDPDLPDGPFDGDW